MKLLKLVTNCSMFFSWRVLTAVLKSWCCFALLPADVPDISLAFSASRASSGAMRKYLERALVFSVFPISPPDTFID